MAKTAVYSWRLSPNRKTELEEAARNASKNLAQILDELTEGWVSEQRARAGVEDERQKGIREKALESVGAIRGGDAGRAENARSAIRERLALRRAR